MKNDILYKVEKETGSLKYTVTKINGKTETIAVYELGRSINRKKLKQLLELAKGKNRTMAQFAEACSNKKNCPLNEKRITTPVLSRIMQEKASKGPLKAELIQAILNNADNKNLVTPEELMEVNGFVEERKNNRVPKYNNERTYYDRFRQSKLEFAVSDIDKALKKKGFKIIHKYPCSSSDLFTLEDGKLKDNTTNKYGLDMNLDYAVSVKDKDGNKFIWGFVIDCTDPEGSYSGETIFDDEYEDNYLNDSVDEFLGSDITRRQKKFFLRSLMDPDSMKDIKISFVCQNRTWYNDSVKLAENYTSDSYMSFVLIKWGEVVSEYTVDNNDLEKPDCLLGDFCEYNEEDYYRDAPDAIVEIEGVRRRKKQKYTPVGYR